MAKWSILITGATGFIGKYVLKKLMGSPTYNLILLVRDPVKLEKIVGKEFLKNLKIIQGDLLKDVKLIEKQIESINPYIKIVINLVGGGPLTINYNKEKQIMDLNLSTLKNLIRILAKLDKFNQIELFLHFSSLAAVGTLSPVVKYSESTICNPVLPYERAKYLSEIYLRKIANRYKQTKFVILRLPQVYGLESKEFITLIELIKKGLFPLIPNKFGTLPLIYVNEVANIVRHIINNYKVILCDKLRGNFKIFLVCERAYPYINIINIVKETFGKGGFIPVPYKLMYLLTFLIENIFKLLNKDEPFNIYRLRSFCRIRIVKDNFSETFNYQYKYNLNIFLKILEKCNKTI